jgi:RIO-like serine/threonine protein kinase
MKIDATYWTDVQRLFSVLSMHYDISVLRAILRLSRHRRSVDQASLALRVEGEASELRAALRRLEAGGLIVRTADTARLTMVGLAVGVASLRQRPNRRRTAARIRTAA